MKPPLTPRYQGVPLAKADVEMESNEARQMIVIVFMITLIFGKTKQHVKGRAGRAL
jgi:hypothetical protein